MLENPMTLDYIDYPRGWSREDRYLDEIEDRSYEQNLEREMEED